MVSKFWCVWAASEAMELLHYGLPDLSDMGAAIHTSGVAMQAAE